MSTQAVEPVAPGGVIGILGGGQLGRMLALAAARLGLKTHIYAPDGDNPAIEVAHAATIADWDDEQALRRFAESVDVITYEFENIPLPSLAVLARHAPVRPGARSLEVTQDRLREKTFARDLGIPVPAFAGIERERELADALRHVGLPAVLKTRRFGYDGKGQVMLRAEGDAADEEVALRRLADAWESLGRAPCILERFVPFACEASAILARGLDGGMAVYDVPRNEHEHHVLRHCHLPSGLQPPTEQAARDMARRLASALEHVGVLALELFVLREADGTERLLFNEFAPRVHNSGHWTEAACDISQFELHVRAICGWPLPQPRRHHDCIMTNLLGQEADDWRRLAAQPHTVLHLYGKRQARPGRKMGHFTRLLAPVRSS